jgi:hypothetical protein
MKPWKVIVAQQYDVTAGIARNTFLVDAEAVKAADEWITRNKDRMPPPEEIGMVMPYFVVYGTVDGDLEAPTTERIEVYREIDSHGTIAIPWDEIEEFTRILTKWGQPRLP